jgi:hypothetical protein
MNSTNRRDAILRCIERCLVPEGDKLHDNARARVLRAVDALPDDVVASGREVTLAEIRQAFVASTLIILAVDDIHGYAYGRWAAREQREALLCYPSMGNENTLQPPEPDGGQRASFNSLRPTIVVERGTNSAMMDLDRWLVRFDRIWVIASAGVIAALLQALLSSSSKQIIADYMTQLQKSGVILTIRNGEEVLENP